MGGCARLAYPCASSHSVENAKSRTAPEQRSNQLSGPCGASQPCQPDCQGRCLGGASAVPWRCRGPVFGRAGLRVATRRPAGRPVSVDSRREYCRPGRATEPYSVKAVVSLFLFPISTVAGEMADGAAPVSESAVPLVSSPLGRLVDCPVAETSALPKALSGAEARSCRCRRANGNKARRRASGDFVMDRQNILRASRWHRRGGTHGSEPMP